MKAKKWIALLLAAVCACTVLAACGNKTEPTGSTEPTGAEDTMKFKTIGEALALDEGGSYMSATYEKAYVYAFENDGVYWRLAAELTPEQYTALSELDILSDDYEEKEKELLSSLAVTKCENLNEKKLTDDEMAALVGKTGKELLDGGWMTGSGYNLDTMEFFMEYPPFAYTVTFEKQEQLENTDDFDEEAAISGLKVVSVAFDGLGDSCTDMPEYYDDWSDDTDEAGID